MLRAFSLLVVSLALAGPAYAAGDIETCRDGKVEAGTRLAACERVIADDKAPAKPKAYAYWFRGDAMMKQRDFSGAITSFDAAYSADPDNVSYLSARGNAYRYSGDDDHALADYDACLRMRPNYAPAYDDRGWIYMRRGEVQRALEEFNSAVKYAVNDGPRYVFLVNRGRAETLLKRFDAALADFAEAEKINAGGWQVPAQRCITYAEMQKFDEALADCNAALAKQPQSDYFLTSRANAYLASGNLDAALDDYGAALKIAPNSVRALAGRGQLFEKKGDMLAARDSYRAASAVQTRVDDTDTAIARRFARERLAALASVAPANTAGDADTCRNTTAEAAVRLAACESVIADDKAPSRSRAYAFWFRGDTLMKRRDYDKALAAFDAAHAADPDNVAYINSRGIAYANKGDDDHALADYEACLRIRPNYAPAYNNRGLILMRRGDFSRALDAFNAAVKYASDGQARYIHLYNRARAETLLRQYDAALADFAEAEQVNPGGTQVPVYRCATYIEMKKLDEALADCNAALAKDPKASYLLTSRANAYLAKGNLDAALDDYNAALRIAPNNIRAHAGRGQLFEKKGDVAAARYDYRSASVALTKFDEIDTAIARRLAKERLAALAPPPPSPSPSGSRGPRKVALIVGNGAYKSVPALENPPRDAKLIASTFRDLGFAVVTLASDLGRDKFFAALRDFGGEAEKSDWAVVYYAGHGMEIGGVNYLIPTDARLVGDNDAETQAVALEQVIAAVSGARKLRLVMLDACRDNPFEENMKRTIGLKLVGKGLSNIEPEAGFMVVYAAKHGETALDGDSGNSPFATALARDIKEPKVEVRKLFDIVRDDVWAATRHAQQPFTYGSLPGREDFYFVAAK